MHTTMSDAGARRLHMLGLSALVAAVALAGCGGGGSDSSSAPAPVPAPAPGAGSTAFPTARPAAGDWAVYDFSVTPSAPASASASQRTITRVWTSSDASGYVREDLPSTRLNASVRFFDAASAISSFSSGTNNCTYSPNYREGPPLTSVVGDSFQSTSQESCTNSSSGAVTTNTFTVQGTNVGIETKTIPLGTFTAFKYTQTIQLASPNSLTTTTQTCWIDTLTARTLECQTSYQTVPTAQTAATSAGTTLLQLKALRFQSGTPIGATQQRFAGYWKFTFSSPLLSGSCDEVLIDAAGQFSGQCRFTNTGSSTPQTQAISGSVANDGTATLSVGGALSLTGTFDSPRLGAGNLRVQGSSTTIGSYLAQRAF